MRQPVCIRRERIRQSFYIMTVFFFLKCHIYKAPALPDPNWQILKICIADGA